MHNQVGENWTSPTDVCETYQCSEASEGKLEKVTTVKSCDTACQPVSAYCNLGTASRSI